MADFLPEGENLRRAVRWISDSLQEGSDQPILKLVNEATFKFDLSPKDSEFLVNFFGKQRQQG